MNGLLDQLAMLSANPSANTLGPGLAGGAADITLLKPIWMQEFAEGLTQLTFPMWLKQRQTPVPNIPKQ